MSETENERACARMRQLIAAGLKECRGFVAAIGDETRQNILLALLENERWGMRVGEITERTHLSRPAVSHHLRILRDANLVTVERQGTMNFYRADAGSVEWARFRRVVDQVDELIAFAVTSHEAQGDRPASHGAGAGEVRRAKG